MSKHRELTPAERKLPIRQRQYKHVFESLIAQGKSEHIAKKIASAVVNKTRARFAETGRGPKLIKRGGSRRQWYPGKKVKTPRQKRAALRCLKHHRAFKTLAGFRSHMRSKQHKRHRS